MSDPLFIGLATGGALLLSFLLFTNPKNNNINANRWLGAFVGTIAFAMLEIFLHNLNLHRNHPAILDLIEASRFLSAPALYLSVSFFTSVNKKDESGILWHFVLFLVLVLFLLPHMLTGENFKFSNQLTAEIVFALFRAALPLQTILYWYWSYRKLRYHQQNTKQIASSIEEVDLSWLKYFLLVLAAVVLIWLNLAVFNFAPLFGFTPLLYLLSVYFLAYFALKQKEIYPFAKPALKELEIVISSNTHMKAEKQKRLTESQTKFLNEKLENLMQSEKVYLNNELSLPVLAQKMEISIHELSYLINDVHGENFFSFVNKYRIEEAKCLLLSDKYEKLNILGIAYQAGFNSKTTFNTVFKKSTGQSPSKYVLTQKNKF